MDSTALGQMGFSWRVASGIFFGAIALQYSCLPRIEKTKDLVQGISTASEEQHSGAGQINLAIQELEQVIQQNASASAEMAATAETLSEQAQELQRPMRFFTLDGEPRHRDDGAVSLPADSGVEPARPLQVPERANLLDVVGTALEI